MVDRHLVEQKLAAIADRVARLETRRPASRASFMADRDLQELIAFNVFLAFQEALDLAAHLISDACWTFPTTAREHFSVLSRHGVLTPETAAAMGRCAGLRNLIAHAYGTLDLGRLYDEVPDGMAALRAFCAEIARQPDEPPLTSPRA